MKIIKKCFLYIAILAIVVLSLNLIVPNPYKKERQKIEDIIEYPSKYKSFAFGRSHAASLNYDYYKKKGLNFALGGRDLASIEYMIQYLIPRCDSLEEIFIFVSYTSLYFDNTAMSAGNLNDARKELYYTIPTSYPIDYTDINNFIFGKILTFVQADHGQKMLKKNINEDEEKGEYKILSKREMIKSGKDQARRDILDKENSLLYNNKIVRDNSLRLKNIISFCKQNKVNVYLIQAPYYHTYNDFVPEDIIYEVDSVVRDISSSMKVPYYDFSNDERFKYSILLFQNSDHLNSEGKKEFTKLLNKIII